MTSRGVLQSKKILGVMIILIGILAILPMVSATWWDNNWNNKIQLNITGLSSLSDFKQYVQIDKNAGMNADYSDIRFLNSSETGELTYDLDWINSSSAGFWVKIPTFTTLNILYIYYNNSGATSTKNGADTWNNEVGVYYLNGTSDRKGKFNFTADSPYVVEGKFGNAINCTGGADSMVITNIDGLMKGLNKTSISFWLKETHTLDNDGGGFIFDYSAGGNDGFSLSAYQDLGYPYLWGGLFGSFAQTQGMVVGWANYVYIRNETQTTLYNNGVYNGSSISEKAGDLFGDGNFSICDRNYASSSPALPFWNIDNVVISNYAKSLDEVKQDYQNGNLNNLVFSSPSSKEQTDTTIHITNCTDLQAMNDNLTANYILDNNIDCSDTINWNSGSGNFGENAGFIPIGNYNYYFTGTFNGQGYNITDLYSNKNSSATNYYDFGLFGHTNNAVIINTNLINVTILGNDGVAGLIGEAYNSKIENCSASGNILFNLNGDGYDMGGLIGYADNSTIDNSYAVILINDTGNGNIGGLIGNVLNSVINNSYAVSTLYGSGIGGLIGYGSYAKIYNSYAISTIRTNWVSGGIAGTLDNSIIDNFYGEVNITTTTGGSGGYYGVPLDYDNNNSEAYNSNIIGNIYYDCEATEIGTIAGVGGFLIENNVTSNVNLIAPATCGIHITTCNELQAMNDNLTANYILDNNIDCSDTINWNLGEGFIPIGSTPYTEDYSVLFTGTFNGQGYNITDLYINLPDELTYAYVGLFGITGGSEITNVNLVNASVTGYYQVGILVGEAWGTPIINCSAQGIVNLNAITSYGFSAGGLVGSFYGNYGENIVIPNVDNSFADVEINTLYDDEGTTITGGLIGWVSKATITNSYATGTINGLSGSYNAGGLIGSATNINMDNCSSSTNIPYFEGTALISGGLIGKVMRSTNITNSYATGNVAGDSQTGGLIGWVYPTQNTQLNLTNSYATGNVNGNNLIGGLIGVLEPPIASTITDCYATGNVTSAVDSYAGGLVGQSENTLITNTYSAGYISGISSTTGGLIGNNFTTELTCVNSYWNEALSGQTISACGTALNNSEMITQSSYTDWDFTNIWDIQTNSTPYLRFNPVPFFPNFPAEEEIALVITSVSYETPITLNGGTTKDIYIIFNTSTPLVNVTSAQVIITDDYANSRTSSSCSNISTEFNCSITMQFYDNAGDWYINASIKGDDEVSVENSSTSFVVNALDYVTQDLTYINWGSINPNTNDNEASNTIILSNKGNQGYNIFTIAGQNATGISYAEIINANRFSIDNIGSSTSGQIYMESNTPISVTSKLSLANIGASIDETIYFYVDIPAGLKADSYISDSAWTIQVATQIM